MITITRVNHCYSTVHMFFPYRCTANLHNKPPSLLSVKKVSGNKTSILVPTWQFLLQVPLYRTWLAHVASQPVLILVYIISSFTNQVLFIP